VYGAKSGLCHIKRFCICCPIWTTAKQATSCI